MKCDLLACFRLNLNFLPCLKHKTDYCHIFVFKGYSKTVENDIHKKNNRGLDTLPIFIEKALLSLLKRGNRSLLKICSGLLGNHNNLDCK